MVSLSFSCLTTKIRRGKDVLEFVLSVCHPARLQLSKPPPPAKWAGSIIDVATRYGIDWAVNAVLRDPLLLNTNPLLLFAHACHQGLASEAAIAAKATLRLRIEDFPSEPALELVSGYKYQKLQEFHRRCGKAAAAIARGEADADWITEKTLHLLPVHHDPCSMLAAADTASWNLLLGLAQYHGRAETGRRKILNSSQRWWIEHMLSTATALESTPHNSTVTDRVHMDGTLMKVSSCAVCVERVGPFMRDFIPLFEQKINDVIRQIIEETVFI